MIYDIAIIGGGPAGMTAALYGHRAGKSVIIFERDLFGGNVNNAPNIENYPGFTCISGMELVEKMYNQIEDHVECVFDEIIDLKYDSCHQLHQLETFDSTYFSKSVILATGTEHRKLMLPNEEEYSGISYCALCDGAFYKDKEVLVIGGGNSAFQEAIYLSDICSKVTLAYRGSQFRADSQLITKAESIPNITLLKNLVPIRYIADNEVVTGMEFSSRTCDFSYDPIKLFADGIFIAIGQDPNTTLLTNDDVTFKNGFEVDFNLRPENIQIPGIFVAGDCIYKSVKQISTAISDGAIAATNAIEYLNMR